MMKRAVSAVLALCLFLPGFALAGGEAANAASLTLRQQIMQKIMVDFTYWSETDEQPAENAKLPPLTEITPSIAQFLAEYQPGGVILFKSNLPSTESSVKLIRDIRLAVTKNGGVMPLLAVDQEGGAITRLVMGTSMPGNMALGATRNPQYAYLTGEILGKEVAALGFSMNCAPDLDVNSNPENPVIGVRSFGETPELVSSLGLSMIEGLEKSAIIPVVKHFPGHGDTQTDSHSALPIVSRDLKSIEEIELAPFKAAIDAGVPAIMSAHIQFPALDKTQVKSLETGEMIYLPATLSRKIMTGLLRETLGFDGVIMTDAMNMDAIAKHFGPEEALIRAFEAGVDIAVMPFVLRGPKGFLALEAGVSAVEAAVKSGRLDPLEIEASVDRILSLKKNYGVLDQEILSERAQLEAANAIIASPESRKIEREIARASITRIRDDDTLPITPESGDKLLLIGAYENEVTAMRYGVNRLIAEGALPQIECLGYSYTNLQSPDAAFDALLEEADAAIVVSELGNGTHMAIGHWRSDMPVELIRRINETGKPYCALSLSLPQDSAYLKEAKALLCLYNPAGMSDAALSDARYAAGPSLPAAMDVIFGAATPEGKLPVTVYDTDDQRAIHRENTLYPFGYAAD